MAITVQNLTKVYGMEKAVDDISFEVRSGEILGFLGPNGAGKTTTMKIITCYMPPNSGSVSVDGLDIAEHSLRVRKKIGYLPEMNPLYHDMNVIEYLDYAATLHGVKEGARRPRIKEMVDVCGLGDVRHKDIGELSKGYRQRVGLAQAMIHDPEVLILDEPTSGLDPNQIVEIRNLIKKLGMAKTVVLSTHILSEVEATCDRVVIVNKGKIVADGTVQELRQKFRSAELLTVEFIAPSANAMDEFFPKFKIFPEVSSVDYTSVATDVHKFTLGLSAEADIRAKVFQLAVAEKWTLLEMHRERTSLEEVFHTLTKS